MLLDRLNLFQYFPNTLVNTSPSPREQLTQPLPVNDPPEHRTGATTPSTLFLRYLYTEEAPAKEHWGKPVTFLLLATHSSYTIKMYKLSLRTLL